MWHEDGTIHRQEFYKNDIPTEQKSWYPNGNLESELYFDEGQIITPKNGINRHPLTKGFNYNEDGSLRREENLDDWNN